ncbi:MAG: MerR family transcriptional regulator [Erysipelotrichaceae bacterium]|nr:MerR family transcriptional regulator [Erysipelotrichaceae bacterium]MDY5251415.1 MerR family transcriptional regulator [Erysipelotrichaceae bacterium]
MKYTINDIAKLLGVSSHKLRFYEKAKIIKPVSNNETGYRYYSVLDTRRFNLAQYYRGMNFSLDKVNQLMIKDDIAYVIAEIEKKEQEIQQNIIFEKLCLEEIEHYRYLLSLLNQDRNYVGTIELDDYIRVEFSNDETVVDDPKLLKLRDELLKYSPLIKWVSRIEKDSISSYTTPKYHYGINMRKSHALALGIDISEYELIKKSKYILTFFVKDTRKPYERYTMASSLKYIQDHDIKNFYDGYSSCIKSTMIDDDYINIHYFMTKID